MKSHKTKYATPYNMNLAAWLTSEIPVYDYYILYYIDNPS